MRRNGSIEYARRAAAGRWRLIEPTDAATVWAKEAGRTSEQCALSRSGPAHDHDDLGHADVQRNAAKRVNRRAAAT
jgi:hypothetical protein